MSDFLPVFNDSEYNLLLSAMKKEKDFCRWVDITQMECKFPAHLEDICKSIINKISSLQNELWIRLSGEEIQLIIGCLRLAAKESFYELDDFERTFGVRADDTSLKLAKRLGAREMDLLTIEKGI